MLFSSFVFIFLFLPLALAGFYLARKAGRVWSMWVLTLASIGFYAYWLPKQTWILLVSIVFNFVVGHYIQKYRDDRPTLTKWILIFGLTCDLGALFYFKYTMFVLENLNAFAGADFVIPHIILPLGISFFTFQKIAYLVDCSRGEAKKTTLSEFALFASFFPQLIAGPIVHHKEIIPQFRNDLFGRFQSSNFLVGVSIFSIGLFKKTVIADSIAAFFIPMYKAAAATDGHVDMRTGWLIALGWTLQVYFDFSGYSDMAIGLARMCGVQLPLNFHSPLRASGVIDYWRRWHMSLQRFILAYVFQPLSMPLNRLAVRRKIKGWSGFVVTVVIPSFITFFLLGVWHGAGWNFVVFGLLNAMYVSVNEAYREVLRRRRRARQKAGKPVAPEGVGMKIFHHVVTLACVGTGNVFFRAESLTDGVNIFKGMWGFNGFALNPDLARFANPTFLALLALGVLIVAFLPNTQQIMRNYRPAVNWRQWRTVGLAPIRWVWRPEPLKLAFIAAALFLGVEFIQRGETIFVYFNF
jgi:D-alanyl-lipoteichoic acid acyltransferase DltB (MBOAT superfamily)